MNKDNKSTEVNDTDKKLHISDVSCSVCGSQDIKHEEKEGRGLPPKDWVRKRGDKRKISWRGIWDIWTCNNCGNKVEKLSRF